MTTRSAHKKPRHTLSNRREAEMLVDCSVCGPDVSAAKRDGRLTCLTRLRATKKTSDDAWKSANREKYLQGLKDWHARNPGYIWEAHLRNAYGLTPDEYAELVAEHDGTCDTCGGPPVGPGSASGKFHLDHCHEKKRRRGFLCGKCNTALGLANDDPVVLRAIAAYVEFWQAEHAGQETGMERPPRRGRFVEGAAS